MKKACKIRSGKRVNRREYNQMRSLCAGCNGKADRAMSVQVGAVLYEYLPWPEYGEACYYEVYNANSFAYMFNRIWTDAQSQANRLTPMIESAMSDARGCLGIPV